MVDPDPWKILDKNYKQDDLSSSETDNNFKEDKFEDNFQPDLLQSLPDSKEYLQSLEKRLLKLKKDPNILNQLKARREQCLEHLLSGKLVLDPAERDETFHLEEDFEENRRRDFVRYISPAQPNNLGELVHIINHDQLNVETHSIDDTNELPENHNH